MMTLRDRYQTDPAFKALVDMMVGHIQTCQYTPSEMREAAILASIIYEEHNITVAKRFIDINIEYNLRTVREHMKQIMKKLDD